MGILPSLATLPEMLAHPGLNANALVGVFAGRDVYLSSLGAIPDCDVKTGGKVNPVTLAPVSGTPTDNSAIINNFLANQAGRLIVDGGYQVAAPIVYRAGNSLVGRKDGDGFHVRSGSNCNGMQNYPHTDLQNYLAWNPTGSQAGLGGSGFWLDNITINANRGTYPNGNASASSNIDGTINGTSAPLATYGPSAKGPYLAGYWLSGIVCVGMDNVHMRRVTILDAPTYHINLYHVTDSSFEGVKAYAGDNTVQNNTDALHMNGGCDRIYGTRCDMRVGDDPFALNLAEGDGQPGGTSIVFTDSYVDSLVIGRIYGKGSATLGSVVFKNITGFVSWYGFTIGESTGGADTGVESNRSIVLEDINVVNRGRTGRTDHALVLVAGNVGVLDMVRCKSLNPTFAHPMVRFDVNSPSISTLRMTSPAIHRSAAGNAAAWLVEGANAGSIGSLVVDGLDVTSQLGTSYSDIPTLINLAGTAVGRVGLNGVAKGVGTVLNVATSSVVGAVAIDGLDHASNAGSPTARTVVAATSSGTVPVSVGRYTPTNLAGIASGAVTLSGPGLAGLVLADSAVADNWRYLRAGNVPAIKLGGVVNLFSMTTASSLAPGVATAGSTTSTTAAATATDATGGTTPYSYQWYRSTASGSLGSAVSGQTTRTLADTGLTAGTTYYYTLKYTDSAGTPGVVYSNQIAEATGSGTTYYLQADFSGSAGSIDGTAPSPHQLGTITFAGFSGLPSWTKDGSGKIVSPSGSGGFAFDNYDLTGTNTDMTATVVLSSTDAAASLILQFNRDSGASNYFEVSLTYASGGSVTLKKTVAGTTSTVTSASSSFSTGTTYTAVVTVLKSGGNTTVAVSVNGTSVIAAQTIADSTVQPPGLFVFGQTAGAEGTLAIDSMTITNP